MSKLYARFIAALFALFLAGLLAVQVALPDRAKSETENRTLQQLPAFSWSGVLDGSFMADVEEYVQDQFPFRDQWTGLKARAEQLAGKRLFNDVYLCEGETLIAKVARPDGELVEKNFSYILRLAEKTGANVHLGFIPSAAGVWQDKLPAGAVSYDQNGFLQQAAETGLPMIDFHGALTAHADEPIYYRTDHHWTSLGAFYGANALLESLGRETLDMADFIPQTVSRDFNGTLYSQSGIHWLTPDTMEYWVPEDGLTVTSWRSGAPEPAALYDRTYLDQKDKYSSFLGGNQPLCVIRNETLPESAGKILLIRDSYSDALAPFLSQRFREVHLLDLRYYRAPSAAYAAENGIEDIVVLYSIQNFISDRNLVLLPQ